ncbi:MAG: polyphosphate polymerase domain-containing protein [Sedimentisphaerales bacterium]|nr:polyphosphate polymerase domain-containing protein [Sedimentisphaerales bacterium]
MQSIPTGRGADHSLWCRYEMKYVISEAKAAAIVQFLEPFLQLDRFCRTQPRAEYPIVSLYLDSDNLQLCRESLSGLLKRFKLRVRSYSDDADSPRFFEIKRRSNAVIIKSRAAVSDNDVAVLLAGHYVPPLQNRGTEVDALKQFQLYMKNINAGPKVLIRYMRQAYEGEGENRVRVTFDRQLTYKVSSDSIVSLGGSGWQHNMEGVILEIKFTGRYPAWLGRMVRYFNLQQQSMSKYVTSVKKALLSGFCAPAAQLLVY